MSNLNIFSLSNIPEEKYPSVSDDSLENVERINNEDSKEDGPSKAPSDNQSSNVNLPSFHILPSSHCDVTPGSKPATSVGSAKTFYRLTDDVLFIKEDSAEVHKKSCGTGKQEVKINKAEKQMCRRTVIRTQSAASGVISQEKSICTVSSQATSKSELNQSQNQFQSKTVTGKHQSRIPVAVGSSLVIDTVRQSIEQNLRDEAHPVLPCVNVGNSSPQSVAHAPKAAERRRSHHTIERPAKDFIQLNKRCELRRTKTYHSVHLERRTGRATADDTTEQSISSMVAAATGAPSAIAGHSEVSAADLTSLTYDPPVTSGQSPDSGSSPRASDSRPEDSLVMRSSRIPVRTGSGATPRRRHHSHESLRSHQCYVSRHQENVSREGRHLLRRELSDSRLDFHESYLSYASSESELTGSGLRLPHSHLSLIDVNDNRQLLHGSRRVYTPPERVPMPYRHVEYRPNLKPYPRKYINLGKLGPDPDSVRARQEKMQRQQEYAEQVAKKNRAVVKQKSHQYAKQQQQTQSAHIKMVSYSRTVPKPKQKVKPPSTPTEESREMSPMLKTRKLLTGNSLPRNHLPSQKLPGSSNSASSRSAASLPPQPGTNSLSSRILTHAKPPPAGRPVAGRQHSVGVTDPPLLPLPLPTLDAPKTSVLPPKDNRQRSRRLPGRSATASQARVANSLLRLRSLTDQLVTGPHAAPSVGDASKRLCKDGTSPTFDASSDMDSDYSTDSLISASHSTAAPMRRGYVPPSPRDPGLFPPAQGCSSCRRPTMRCSRIIGPDPQDSVSRSEDLFYDKSGGNDEFACGEGVCSPPLSPHRRPAVTRGTQSTSMPNKTFVVHKNSLVVDIGLPVTNSRTRRSSLRPRLGKQSSDSVVDSPPTEGRMHRPDQLPSDVLALQMMRDRHLRDKKRVDAIISGCITRM